MKKILTLFVLMISLTLCIASCNIVKNDDDSNPNTGTEKPADTTDNKDTEKPGDTSGDKDEEKPGNTTVDEKAEKYAAALASIKEGKYEEAYKALTELGGYQDAAKEAAKFHYVYDGFTETYGIPEEMDSETVVITYNEDNLPIKYEKTFLDGFVQTCTLEYDENGRLITRECMDGDEFYGKHEWTYDENGNNLTCIVNYYDGTSYTETRTYDENGNNLTIVAYGNGGYYDEAYEGGYYANYEIFYDENGNNTSYFAIDGDQTIEGQLWYTEDGTLTRALTTLTWGEDVTLEEELYDENGNLSKKTVTKDGEVLDSTVFTYDENGNLISEVNKWSEEGEEYVITCTYSYDENGNCIKIDRKESDGYTSVRNATFKLVYIPYEYSEDEWKFMNENFDY